MSDSWKTGVSGDWGVAGNWTAGVPVYGENATIAVAGDYTVTVSATENFQSNLLLDNQTATLDVVGVLYDASSTFAAGVLDLTGTLLDYGSSSGLGSSTLVAGSIKLAGTLFGTGSLELDGGTLALDGGDINLPTVSLAGADMVLQSGFDYGGNFVESAGTLDLNGFNATLSGIAELGTGGYTIGSDNGTTFAVISGPGTLDITNFAEANAIYLSNGVVLQDNGIIIDTGYLYFGGYDPFYGDPTASASMSISTGGVFDFAASTVPQEYQQFPITYVAGPASSIVNAGLFEMIAAGSNPILPFFTNLSTGTIYAGAGADLQFTGGGVLAGQVKGAGEIDMTGGTYALADGLVINVASFVIAGENFAIPVLQLDGSVTLTGNGHLGEGNEASALSSGVDATVTGQGVLDVAGTADINSFNLTGGAVLKDSGVVTLDGNLDFGDDSLLTTDTGSDAALLSIASGGVFDIVAAGAINNLDVINGDPTAASIVNNGLFELTSGTGQNEVDGPFINAGTVAVLASTLLLTGIDAGPAGTLTGGIWEAKATNPAGATLALETPTAITTDDAQIILSRSGSDLLSGPSAGTAIEQSLTLVASGGVLSLLDARGFTAAKTITDAGSIQLQGGVFAAPTLDVAGGGTFNLHGATLAAPALDVARGGIFGGYGTITGAVENDGLIKATNATLTIMGNVSGTGSLFVDPQSELILEGAVKSGTDVTFGHSLAILGLEAPTSFSGTLVSFQPADTIELIGVSSITSEHFSNGILTLTDSVGSIALTFANPAAFSSGLAVHSAGGNTSITEASAGNQTAIPEIGGADIDKSTDLSSIFGQPLPLDPFLTEHGGVNANIVQEVAPDESASRFGAGHSDLFSPMMQAHSIIMQFMKHG